MALKKKITQTEFDKLKDEVKFEYKKDGEVYVLDLETDPDDDPGELRRAKQREVEARKEAQAALRKAEERLAEIEGDDARKKGDIATLEKSWQSKLETQKTEFESKIAKLEQHVTKGLVDNVALQLSTKLFKNPTLALPHIKARLAADLSGDAPATRVLDASGKISALSLEDLEKEIVANKDFSDILLATKATGAGGKVANMNVGGAETKPVNLSKIDPKQLAEHLKEKAETESN